MNSLTKTPNNRKLLKPYVTTVYIIAGLQFLMPIIWGNHLFSVLGVGLAVLGFSLSRQHIWAAVLLVIIGSMNAVILALQSAFGSSVQSIVLVACGIRSFWIIQQGKRNVHCCEGKEIREGRVNTRMRRTVVVVVGLLATASVIALGASPQQGGLLGAVLILVFWAKGKKDIPALEEPERQQTETNSSEVKSPEKVELVNEKSVTQSVRDRAPCPFCAENIKTKAILCRYCKSNLDLDWFSPGATVLTPESDYSGPPEDRTPEPTRPLPPLDEKDNAQKVPKPEISVQQEDNNSILEQRQAVLMARYGITFDGENYHFRKLRYAKLEDAVSYAKFGSMGGLS